MMTEFPFLGELSL